MLDHNLHSNQYQEPPARLGTPLTRLGTPLSWGVEKPERPSALQHTSYRIKKDFSGKIVVIAGKFDMNDAIK